MPSKENMTDAEDVLEFLDSLPETKGTPKQRSGKKNETEDEHILDFLDELEQSNLTISSKKGSVEGLPREKSVKKTAAEEQKDEKPKPANRNELSDNKQEAADAPEGGTELKHEQKEASDPISSLSSWWSSSGQATVSNMWSKTAKHANQIKDRLAQEQQELTTKLNTTSFTSKLTNTSVLADLTSQLTKIVVGDTEEVLRIHVVHDLVNFHGLSYQIESQFDKVLKSQVQGEVRIFVDQWDRPNETHSFSSSSTPYQLNLFQGKSMEGDKLCMANLENAIKLFKKAKDEFQKQRGASDLEAIQEEESKISDVFVGILAVGQQAKDGIGKVIDTSSAGNFNFTLVLKDISNDISLIVRSQGFPIRWVDWLEGKTETKDKSSEAPADVEVDPSEWIAEWIDQGLELSIGVLAQNYIIERMGI